MQTFIGVHAFGVYHEPNRNLQALDLANVTENYDCVLECEVLAHIHTCIRPNINQIYRYNFTNYANNRVPHNSPAAWSLSLMPQKSNIISYDERILTFAPQSPMIV